MTTERFKLAGWLAVTNAVLTIPILILSVFLRTKCGVGTSFLIVMLDIISLCLFIFIFSSLKQLFNSRFNFQDTDSFITFLIWANAAITMLGILGTLSSALKSFSGIVSLVLIIPSGIVFIVFAIKMLRLPDNLYGLLKPFAYTTIATGFFTATIILIPIALFSSAVADIILGIIFFRAAES